MNKSERFRHAHEKARGVYIRHPGHSLPYRLNFRLALRGIYAKEQRTVSNDPSVTVYDRYAIVKEQTL